MKTLAEVTKELNWLGEVVDLQTIGVYQIAIYKIKDFNTRKITENLGYHGYVNGKSLMSETFSTLEECLVCNIATARGDHNGDAGRYFMKMTEQINEA